MGKSVENVSPRNGYAPGCACRTLRTYEPFTRWRLYLLLILGFHLLLTILRFDAKVSIGGDDSWYIIAALDFWHGTTFPSWHGAFYPMLISPLIALFGIHVPALKILSILFSLGALALLGIAFRRYLPRFVWLFALLLTAAAPQMVTLSGSTFSEPLFMLLQALIFFLFLPFYNGASDGLSRETFTRVLPLGLALLLLSLTRNVGYGALLALMIFLATTARSWKKTAMLLASYLLFFIPFAIYKRVKWGLADASFSGQLSKMMLVDFYQPDGEKETFWGLCVRVWQNALQYLTGHLPSFLGINVSSASIPLLLLLILGGIAIVTSRRTRSAFTWLLAIYLTIMLGITFLTQQVQWNQFRLIIVYLPLILAFFLYGLNALLSRISPRIGNIAVGSICCLSLLLTTSYNIQHIDLKNFTRNLKGDAFAGLTPDWDSYLRVCQWAGAHLPDSAVIACRKPNNARIYAERPFLGIFRYISDAPDSVWAYFDERRVDYLILARLRADPKVKSKNFINSLHFNAFRLLERKPDCLELIYHNGDSEPAYLFRINRESLHDTDPARYQKALESGLLVYPSNFDALHKLALLALQQQRPNDALTYTDRAIAIADRAEMDIPYPILEIKAMAIYQLGDARQAAHIFEQLSTANPENPSLLYNQALCTQKYDPPRAQQLFDRAKRLAQAQQQKQND